jgi:hypothetical protein
MGRLVVPHRPVFTSIGWASEHGVVKVTKDFYLQPPASSGTDTEMVALPVPREPIPASGSHSADREYLKAQNKAVRERRRRRENGFEEEEEEEEEEETEEAADAEIEEEENPSLTTGLPPSLLCLTTTAASPPGIEHLDTMTVHLRGVVHENIPSEFHDLFYLFAALVGLSVLYVGLMGVRRVGRLLGLSSSQGKSE